MILDTDVTKLVFWDPPCSRWQKDTDVMDGNLMLILKPCLAIKTTLNSISPLYRLIHLYLHFISSHFLSRSSREIKSKRISFKASRYIRSERKSISRSSREMRSERKLISGSSRELDQKGNEFQDQADKQTCWKFKNINFFSIHSQAWKGRHYHRCQLRSLHKCDTRLKGRNVKIWLNFLHRCVVKLVKVISIDHATEIDKNY